MTTKNFNGKAIYNPSGKAAEYSAWACNFYVGCSNGCEYCYCKKGILAPVMGMDKPQLKKCFKNESDAYDTFKRELKINLSELRKYGLFFSFTTDPMLPETKELTMHAIIQSVINKVPVKILTKVADFIDMNFLSLIDLYAPISAKSLIAFGFTLTGHDELEPNASSNAERIEAGRKLSNAGFKVFFSIEPVIDFKSSSKMIVDTLSFCDLYKVGLMSGMKYDKNELTRFGSDVLLITYANEGRVYFKDSFLKQAGWTRESLPSNCVTRYYNIFNQ